LEVKNVKKHFPLKRNTLFDTEKRFLRAVDGISFSVYPGETLGLVGESGCGKSTASKVILKLQEATAGDIYSKGENITKVKGEKLRKLRQYMQIIFQDHYASLNPRKTVEKIITEPMKIFNVSKAQRQKRLAELLDVVGLIHSQK